jgi:hypothetical protein
LTGFEKGIAFANTLRTKKKEAIVQSKRKRNIDIAEAKWEASQEIEALLKLQEDQNGHRDEIPDFEEAEEDEQVKKGVQSAIELALKKEIDSIMARYQIDMWQINNRNITKKQTENGD